MAKRAGGETQGHPTRCGEPDITLFSGAVTLIRPCPETLLGHRRRRPAEGETTSGNIRRHRGRAAKRPDRGAAAIQAGRSVPHARIATPPSGSGRSASDRDDG